METQIYYPTLLDRFKGMVIDGFIIATGLVVVGLVIREFPSVPGFVRGILFVLIFLLYEPLMVSTGGTIGQRIMKLRVRSYADQAKNLFFPLSVVRTIIKWVLGWISFLGMIDNPQKRAFHDKLSNSIVVYAHAN